MRETTGEGRLSPWTMADLTPAERALLTGLRQWFRHGTAGGMAAMRAGFDVARVPSTALLPLFALLGCFAVGRARRPDIRPPSSDRIGLDEMAFLDALAAVQAGEADIAAQSLARWLPVMALSVAVDAARELACILDGACIRLPRRRPARLIALAAE